MITIEEWRDVKNYEGLYQVSNLGRVRSLYKFGSDGRLIKGKVLKGGMYSNGYKFVCLRKESINKNHSIHRLVAKMFITSNSSNLVVNHLDGDKTNNRVDNLEWCTQSENLKHAVDIGLTTNQCKICRTVTVIENNKEIQFESMKSCADYFGYKRGWLHSKIRTHGCEFYYKTCLVRVGDRR